jgi:HCOMODA/2-hydroxy-3-carboxy-muconic semialdehyde decarboxylase
LGEQFHCDPRTIDEAKAQLVLGSHILAQEGILDCFGHISVRNPENPDTFLQSCSVPAELVTPEDIIEIDFNGEIKSGSPGAKAYWERVLHARIFAARPDVGSVFHGHPAEIIPFTVLPDLPILPVRNSGGVFYNGYGFYDSASGSDMTVCTVEEADAVARALGDKWAVLMRSHGVTACADNVPQMVMDMLSMVQNAAAYLVCLQTGRTPLYCSPEEGLAYRKSHHAESPLSRNWGYYARRTKHALRDPDAVR